MSDYAELRAALESAQGLGENCFVALNSAEIRALLAERDALHEALLIARDRIESERRSGEFDPLLRDIEAALAQEQEEE